MKRTLSPIVVALALAACGDGVTGPGDTDLQLQARCDGGMADGFPCDAVDLVAHLPLADLEPGAPKTAQLSDIWGWTDPATGTEYALLGRDDGLVIVDLSEPWTPRPIARLASAAPPSGWRDVKVYADHAYIVADGAPNHGIQILDLTRLRGLEQFTELDEDGRYDGVSSVHNIAINEETGFAYSVGNNWGGETCGGGLHMLDLSDPVSPAFAGCFAEVGTGRLGTGYTHDVQCVIYRGPDETHRGSEVCFGANETHVVIADVTDKANPTRLGTGSYPDHGYVHQGWLSDDHRYFFQNDETDELNGNAPRSRLLVWDVSDLEDPVLAAEHLGPRESIDHNLYVRGDRLYHSNYTFGVRVLDVSDPESPVELGFFDTVPGHDRQTFGGSWSNYPFFESGMIVATSANEGLFVLRPR